MYCSWKTYQDFWVNVRRKSYLLPVSLGQLLRIEKLEEFALEVGIIRIKQKIYKYYYKTKEMLEV